MMTNKNTIRNDIRFLKKTLTVILVGVFLFTNTLGWAKEGELFSTAIENEAPSSSPAKNSKLAPSSRFNNEDFKISLTVAAICKHIEHDGNLDDKSYLNDVLARLDASKNPNITVLPYETIIEIPTEGLAVRYFDPTEANVITPYSDISKLTTKIIGPRLNRQIIRRIKALPEPKALFGSEKIIDLRALLPALDKFQFPQEDEFSRSEGRKPMTLKEVIESQPFKAYKLPVFATSRYSKKILANQREIAGQEKDEISLSATIKKFFPGREQELQDYLQGHNIKALKAHMIELLWEREDVVTGYMPTTLLSHAEREWKIINKLIRGDSNFKDALANPFVGTGEIVSLYMKYFGKEFGSLKDNKIALNFMAHLLLLHDLGKFSLEEKGHEKRSEAILSQIFKSDYFGFSSAEKNLLKQIIGMHAQIELINRDEYEREFNAIAAEAAREGFFDENKLLSILQIWMVFRIAERAQSEHFCFVGKNDFEQFHSVYNKAKNIIIDMYNRKNNSNSAMTPSLKTGPVTRVGTEVASQNISLLPDNDIYWEGTAVDFAKRKTHDYEIQPGAQEWLNSSLRLLPSVDSRILEVGCGDGVLMQEAIRKEYTNILGIDISSDVLKIARQRGIPTEKLAMLNIKISPIPGKFQMIVASDILLYMYDPQQPQEFDNVMNKLASSLNKDGILSVRWAKGNDEIVNKDDRWVFLTSEARLKELMSRHGLEIVSLKSKMEPIYGGNAQCEYWYLIARKIGDTLSKPTAMIATKNVVESHQFSADVIVKNQMDYIDTNKLLFKDALGSGKQDILLRVPIEAIESIGVDNIKDFLATFQKAPNGYVELYYMSGIGEASESMYQRYGIEKKFLSEELKNPEKRTRKNTLTLFPVLKDEKLDQASIVSRIGNMKPKNTILSPIGLQNDSTGLIRSTILGLKIMEVAREGEKIDKDEVQRRVLEDLKMICKIDDMRGLTADDIIYLAISDDINKIMEALKKLIRLLPIAPINADELRQIYEHAKQALIAA